MQKPTNSARCEQCRTQFKTDDEVIWHTELIDIFFCSDECANNYDRQFRKLINVDPDTERD